MWQTNESSLITISSVTSERQTDIQTCSHAVMQSCSHAATEADRDTVVRKKIDSQAGRQP